MKLPENVDIGWGLSGAVGKFTREGKVVGF